MIIQEGATLCESPSQFLAPDDLGLLDDSFLQDVSCEGFPALSGHIEMGDVDRPFSVNAILVDQRPFDLPTLLGSRLNYGISELKMAPSKMVLANETPWSHPLLYKDKMPASMHGKYEFSKG